MHLPSDCKGRFFRTDDRRSYHTVMSLTLRCGTSVVLCQGTLSLSFFPGLPLGERQAASLEGVAKLLDSIWPDAMELPELCFADFGELLESQVASPNERPSSRGGQINREITFLLCHRIFHPTL